MKTDVLASVQKIVDLQSINNIEEFEIAHINDNNNQVVVRKGKFEKGDYCIYCKPGSVLPDVPEFEFLRSRGFIIKKNLTIKGVLSDGLIFQTDILAEDLKLEDGLDVTGILGIEKYRYNPKPQIKFLYYTDLFFLAAFIILNLIDILLSFANVGENGIMESNPIGRVMLNDPILLIIVFILFTLFYGSLNYICYKREGFKIVLLIFFCGMLVTLFVDLWIIFHNLNLL